jgi:hypothetical protein
MMRLARGRRLPPPGACFAILIIPLTSLACGRTRDTAHSAMVGLSFDSAFQAVATVQLQEPDSQKVIGVTALAALPAGHLVLVDERGNRVRIYRRDGTLVRSLARRGHGPGETVEPYGVAAASGGFYVIDASSRVSFFDSTGTYKRAFRVKGLFPIDIEAVPTGLLVGIREPNSTEFELLSEDGVVRHSFYHWPRIVKATPYWASVATDHATMVGSHIAVANSLVYPIRVYGENGTLEDSITVPPPSWHGPSRPRAGAFAGPGSRRHLVAWLSSFTVIHNLVAYHDSLLVVIHGRYDPTETSRMQDLFNVEDYGLDVYTAEGRRIAQDMAPPGHVVAGGRYLYVVTAEPPVAWRITEYKWRG